MAEQTNPTNVQINPLAFDILFEDIRTLSEAYQLDDELRLIEQVSFSLAEDPKRLAAIKSAEVLAKQKGKAAISKGDTSAVANETEGSNDAGAAALDSETLSVRIKDSVSSRTYKAISEIEGRGYFDQGNRGQMAYFFELAHKYILSMPRLQLQVAIDFNEQALANVYAWVQAAIKTKVFLDIVVKPQILAGCMIVYRGVYRDYSLRTQLHENARQIFQPILADIEKRLVASAQKS